MKLEPEQEELLAKFVEAHRSSPRDKRGEFYGSQTMGSTLASFVHLFAGAPPFEGSMADAEVLAHLGLLRVRDGSHGDQFFFVLPQGIQYYADMKRSPEAMSAIEREVRNFVSSSEFEKSHPKAFEKWGQAAALLWEADSDRQLTTIGHLCREAISDFTSSLASGLNVDVTAIEPSKTVGRLKAVIAARSAVLGATEKVFLEALVSYWGAVSDLVQRQEHGALRDMELLLWEDGRRVVFQTCLVMYEVMKAVQ